MKQINKDIENKQTKTNEKKYKDNKNEIEETKV
jgi:hypothetical protein